MGVCENTDSSSATKTLLSSLRVLASTASYLISSTSTGTTLCGVNKMSLLISLQASSDLETCAKFHRNRLTPARWTWEKGHEPTVQQFICLRVDDFCILLPLRTNDWLQQSWLRIRPNQTSVNATIFFCTQTLFCFVRFQMALGHSASCAQSIYLFCPFFWLLFLFPSPAAVRLNSFVI